MLPGRFVRLNSLLTMVFLLAGVAPALAEQRLVRVLWDVGQGMVYINASDRTASGHDGFVVPVDAADAAKKNFKPYEHYRGLQKGDYVRLYVVNYNPIAHVWHASSTAQVVAAEPSLIGGILRSTVAGITGGLKLPQALMQAMLDPAPAVADPCEALYKPLEDLTQAANSLDLLVEEATNLAATLGLNVDARKIADIPTQPLFWGEFDNRKAVRLIRTDTAVFGVDFGVKYGRLNTVLNAAGNAVSTVNDKLVAFDRVLTSINTANPSGSCADVAAHRDTVQAFTTGITAEGSPFFLVAGKYAAATKLLKSYTDKLDSINWSDDAVEVIVDKPIVEDGALRLDAVFVSPTAKFTERTQRSLVLKVQTHFPALTISSGVGIHGFQFKTLAITQDTTAAADGTALARGRIAIVDDPKWDQFVPVWIQNVRMVSVGGAGLYATFGTTPDRNIFKNGIAGFSLVIPRWRTAFTGGIIAARGYEEADLKPIVEKFSDSAGFAIKDAALATLPLQGPKWKQAGYFSITFMLVSF